MLISRLIKVHATSRIFQSRHIITRPAFIGLNHLKKKMAETEPQVGEVHARPDSEAEVPKGKKPRLEGKGPSKRKLRKGKINALPDLCSSDDVLWRDIIEVLGKDVVDQATEEGTEFDSPFEFHEEVELDVVSLSSNGEALARSSESTRRPWTVIVPFSLPGERIRARIYRNARLHSFADLVNVVTPNPELRDESRVQCKYFGSCAGCQYQMLSYDKQLDLKRDVIVKAYKNFSNLPESSVPLIQSTIGSPLQYGYRTKITPHFEAPSKAARKSQINAAEKPDWLHIGFNRIGSHRVMDIEECPIATPVVNEALKPVRDDIIKNILSYKKGASLIIRDSLDTTIDIDPLTTGHPVDPLSAAFEKHVCVTNHKAIVREKVGDWIFEYNGGSFFQNNNSVLVPLTNYVRDAIFSSPTAMPRPTHLVDAYCGAGLFAITLSPHFSTVAGIELSSDSIRFATRNARLNNIPGDKITFRSGDAADIFATVGDFPAQETVLLIDPPRKGCDDRFIEQLLAFRARTVVYVSCNVHTQARDVGAILMATEGAEAGKKYVLESLRGFDLFPQTAHVESVAVLRLV